MSNLHAVRLLSSDADADTVTLGGYGVRFGGHDLYGETFAADTDFGALLDSGALPVYYDHTLTGAPEHQLGVVVKAQADDNGLWIEAQLKRSADYVAEVLQLVEQGVLGWSSGSAAHLVRYRDDHKTIKQWPVVEMSLTPTPAEPRTLGVTYLKARNEQEDTNMSPRNTAQRSAPAPRGEGGIITATDQHTTAFRAYVLRGVKDLRESAGVEGGIIVPETYEDSLIVPLEENSVMRRVAANIVRLEGTAAHKVPTMAYSGAAQLTREEHDYSIDAPSFGEITFSPYKYTRLTKASEELLDDSRIDVLSQVITPDAGRAFAQAENSAFLTGNGASEPQGILSALDTAYQVTSETAAAIKYTDVVDVFYKLPLSYRDRARWLVSDDASKVLRKLQDGAGRPIWETSVQAGQPDLLLGRPVVTTAHLPTVATGNVTMIFGDFSYFWIAEFSDMAVQRLDQLFAATGQIGFRWYRRMDSRVMLPEAFASLKQA